MKFNLIALLFLGTTLSTWADETADKARPILDEVEKGYATLKSGDIPSANKLIRRANEAASILGKATTKDADWVKEAKRFQDLVKKITARAKGKPEPTTDTPDSGESAAPLDARDKHSLRTFNRDHDNYNRTLKSTPAASFKNEQVVANFRTRVGNLRKRYEVLRNKNHPSVKEAAGKVAEYEKAVNEKIKEAGFSEESPESPPVDKPDTPAELGPRDKHYLRSFDRYFSSWNQTLENISPASFQDKKQVEGFQSGLKRLQDQYLKFQDKSHPRIKEAAKKIADFEKAMNEKIKKGASMGEGMGDWKKVIKEWYGRYYTGNVSRMFALKKSKENGPFGITVEQIRALSGKVKELRKEIKVVPPYLEKVMNQTNIKDRSYVDLRNKLKSIQGRMKRIPQEIDSGIASLSGGLENNLKKIHGERWEFYKPSTMTDTGKLSYKRLLDGGADNIVENYTRGKNAALLLLEIDLQFHDKKNEARYKAYLTEFDARIKTVREGAVKALDMVRMPRAESTNSELSSRATRMIKDSKSLPKSWERMVIINDLHETTKEKEYTKDNFLYRVKCTWKWFAVALAYEEDGKYYIYYVLFKYNIRGLPGDTLNKWIITRRGTFKSRQILKGNISRTDSYWPHE